MKNKGWWILFLVFIVSGVRARDSLRISVGYGTLFGGGLGAKIEHRLLHDKIKFHVGVSGGLLPLMSYTTLVRNKHLFMLYENIDKRLVFNTEGLDAVYTDKSKIPFSINISYNIYKNVDGFIGIGTIGRVYSFALIQTSYTPISVEWESILEFYKIFSLNLSTSYKFKRYFFSISFSKGLRPWPWWWGVDNWVIKHSYFISFSAGYDLGYLNFKKIKLWRR
jgi:hypothetical protein